ncbi:hypothetical protein [Acidisphaera rubrifaciens]|uniref:DUF2214 domain-containing protein n=1 Tax=Acidisphaera rubrifaciens HS-AP3 TaxID=1231350 RepID=A0A0D6P8L3_9PROT|nr:hypothetical protein [Acidisphaera rubrifaciens]GAN77558.1 hypothetical protein Asru_0369_08 [Acidisphaera rubrifaciens HS-AP3]
MQGHALAFMRIPFDVLAAIDSRWLHYALQPVHYLIRIVHILSMAAFFGGIGLLDFRLMGWRGSIVLRSFARGVLPWLYVTFGVTVASGVLLFLYDPVAVGSHAFFVPKLILIALGLLNAVIYHQTGYLAALASERTMPLSARLAGAVSLALWVGVIVCAALNVESVPKVYLQMY